jgi:hypothetical integral membrane protein (TIGR02206 family)
MPQIDYTIPTFSTEWWQAVLPLCIGLGILYGLGKMTEMPHKIRLSKGIGLAYIPFLIAGPLFLWQKGIFDIKYSLPLHLCGFSAYLMVAAYFSRKQWLYELCLFYGIAGASQALITPQYIQGVYWFNVVDYWVGHGLLFFSGIFLSGVFNMKPRKDAWWKAAIILNLIAIPISLINWAIDANYLFLCAKPKVNNPLLFGDWPLYILGFEVLIFLLFYLVQIITLKIQNK